MSESFSETRSKDADNGRRRGGVDADTKDSQRSNAGVYATGKKYAKQVSRRRAGKGRSTLVNAASDAGVPKAEFTHAIDFAKAVDRITANCGGKTKRLLLSDHPRLTARMVMKISRVHRDRQLFALEQARLGRNPLGKPSPGTAPPFDTHNPAEMLSRLARNTGAIAKAADGLLETPSKEWPADDKLALMTNHAKAIQGRVRVMKRLVSGGGKISSTKNEVAEGSSARMIHRKYTPLALKRLLSMVATAAAITEKNARDLPRVLKETPPTPAEQAALLKWLTDLNAAAARLAAIIDERDHNPANGPSEMPGTYVVLFRLSEAVTKVKIGDLGTFDFPAGFYGYLGSAFGPGGVRRRTHRHLTKISPNKKWNIDWLKPFCVPVAVWWTHDRRKVEFAWADALGSLSGASYPAKRFGAADNPNAQAHLVRFEQMPSSKLFRERTAASLENHAPLNVKVIEDWNGEGWPG